MVVGGRRRRKVLLLIEKGRLSRRRARRWFFTSKTKKRNKNSCTAKDEHRRDRTVSVILSISYFLSYLYSHRQGPVMSFTPRPSTGKGSDTQRHRGRNRAVSLGAHVFSQPLHYTALHCLRHPLVVVWLNLRIVVYCSTTCTCQSFNSIELN